MSAVLGDEKTFDELKPRASAVIKMIFVEHEIAFGK
jgi:hypothetical protein